MNRFNKTLFNDPVLSAPPSNKQGLNLNETQIASSCRSYTASSDLVIGAICWIAPDGTIFQGFRANYSYTPNKIAGYVIGSNTYMFLTNVATVESEANIVSAGTPSVYVLPTGAAINQELPFWLKPLVSGNTIALGDLIYTPVPTDGMTLKQCLQCVTAPLGRASDNTYVYVGYTVSNLVTNVTDVDLGKLLSGIPNASNLANLANTYP